MNLIEQINQDLKEAMRARDSEKVGTIRMITAAIKQIEVDERIKVDEERLLQILSKLVKQRKESLSHFEAAGRSDLIEKEKKELAIIEPYLPSPLSEEEVTKLIEEAISKLAATQLSDMGKVMAELKPKLQGRADLSKVSLMIKAKLSA